MPKPDELVAEFGTFQIFRKAETREYEIVGPSVQNSPISYTMIRISPESLRNLNNVVQKHARKK
jgi:hypothetical protein